MTQPTLDRLADDLESALRRIVSDSDTTARRTAASTLVDARTHFLTADGHPDYLGRTRAYRDWVGACLSAVVPAAERGRVQRAIAWHTSRILRERYGAEMAAAGVEVAPTDYNAAARAREAAPFTSPSTALTALRAARATVARLTSEVLTSEVRAEVAQLVEDARKV